jgi:hypothetical protein
MCVLIKQRDHHHVPQPPLHWTHGGSAVSQVHISTRLPQSDGGLMTLAKDLLDAETSSISTDEVRELLVNGQISSLIGLLNGEAS